MKQRDAPLAVPTNDMAVRARLRRLGESITLFGEREMERRELLRMIMVKLDSQRQLEKLVNAQRRRRRRPVSAASYGDEEMLKYPFYTEGSKALLEARVEIVRYSIKKAALRLHRAWRRMDPVEDLDAKMDWAFKHAESLVLDCSEIADDRPLSGCSFL